MSWLRHRGNSVFIICISLCDLSKVYDRAALALLTEELCEDVLRKYPPSRATSP